MSSTLDTEIIVTLTAMTCPVAGCGVTYGLDEAIRQARRQDHGNWYCTNGHRLHYPQKNDAEAARAEAARLERRLANEQEYSRSLHVRAEAEKRRHAATKGQLTKARKRAIHAVCPCCNRSFANVRRHIEGQHPDKLAEFDKATS